MMLKIQLSPYELHLNMYAIKLENIYFKLTVFTVLKKINAALVSIENTILENMHNLS